MTMKKDKPVASPKEILSFFAKTAFAQKLAYANLFLVPSTVVLERYVAPLAIAAVLANIQSGTVTLESSLPLIAMYAGIQFYTQIIGYRLNLYAMWTVQVTGAHSLYQYTYEKLTLHSLGFYADNFAGSLVSKVNKFSSAFMAFWHTAVFQALFIVTSLVASIVGLAFILWQFALLLAVLVVLFAAASYYGTRFMRKHFKARSESYTKISAQLSDSLSNILAVKTDGRETFEQKRFKKSVDTMLHNESKARNAFIGVSSVYSVIIATMRVFALVAAIWAVQVGIADAAIVYLCLTYTFNLIQEIWNIHSLFRDYYTIIGDSEEIMEILKQDIGVSDTSTDKLKVTSGAIAFSNVGFRHDAASEILFDDFTLTIKPHERVGIVGVSGSGKTTLTKLLMRFTDVDSGRITIDGTSIADVSQESLHHAVSYVPQEPLLFHRTLAENISYGNPDATYAQIKAAARSANALDFIEDLPDGLETLVGERGVKLSGGQRQRVAIARAILKDAPILVLDEATSALDSESEKLIQQSLETLMKDRTSIVIAHRLSTIAKLDRIVVMNKGAIIEEGTHEELLKRKGTYAKLWGHQSGGFIEE